LLHDGGQRVVDDCHGFFGQLVGCSRRHDSSWRSGSACRPPFGTRFANLRELRPSRSVPQGGESVQRPRPTRAPRVGLFGPR
jgi:hypothetical protein